MARDTSYENPRDRGIDEVEDVFLAIQLIIHLDGMTLNGNATLPFQVHVIEHLCLLVLFGDGVCIFQQTVGQGAFTMVDMGNNAKVTNILHYQRITKLPTNCESIRSRYLGTNGG
jgi:hypothetical protein